MTAKIPHASAEHGRSDVDIEAARGLAPGKRTLTEGLGSSPGAVQRKAQGGGDERVGDWQMSDGLLAAMGLGAAGVQRKGEGAPRAGQPDGGGEVSAIAARGVDSAASPLPHLDSIQQSFGRHDVSRIQAHTDERARASAEAMGAEAFAAGEHVAFAGTPSLHTAAHEAAHVVQQRAGVHLKGGVGEAGDPYERHADAVADLVVQGRSAEGLLDQHSGQRGGQPSGGGHSSSAPTGAVQHKLSKNVAGFVKNWKDKVLSHLGDPLSTELASFLAEQEHEDMSPALADAAVKQRLAGLDVEVLKQHLLDQKDANTVSRDHTGLVKQLAKATTDYSDEIAKEGREIALAASTSVFRVTDAMTARSYLLNGIPITNNRENWTELGPGFYTASDEEGAKNYADTVRGLPAVLEMQPQTDAKILAVTNTRKTDGKQSAELKALIESYDGLADEHLSQYKFHPQFYQSKLKIIALHVKEGEGFYKKYEPGPFVTEFEQYLSSKHKEKAQVRKEEQQLQQEQHEQEKNLNPFTPSPELLSAPDAPDWALRYIAYQEAAEHFEQQLGALAAQHQGAAAEVAKLVQKIWELFPDDKDRAKFGTRQTSITGMVGPEIDMVRRVVETGNLREHLAFLYNGYTGRVLEKKFGKKAFERPEELEGERNQRRERGLGKESTTRMNPLDAQPPLSEREWYGAVDKDGKLGWEPGERLYEMKTYHAPNDKVLKNPDAIPAPFEQLAEITGALTKTGTSGTAYGFLQAAAAVCKETGLTINLPLFRLALLGGMLPVGDHTFHEIMMAGKQFDPSLAYDNSHRRYRTLAPLDEQTLRSLCKDQKFPDELLEQDDISQR